jgi:hypothetical protein
MRPLILLGLAMLLSTSMACAQEGPQVFKDKDSCSAHSGDRIPKYRIARSIKLEHSSNLVLFLSISPEDAGRGNLIALACSLGSRFASKTFLYAYIFDSRDAAKHYNPQGEGNTVREESSYLASYSFARLPDLNGAQLSLQGKIAHPFRDRTDIDLGPPPSVESALSK